MGSQFERDYGIARDLGVATALSMALPKGFFTRLFSIVLMLIVAILGWQYITGPKSAPPLSIVRAAGPVAGLSYDVSAPDGNGAHTVEFVNDLGVRVEEVRFKCISPMSGEYDLLLDGIYEPHSRGSERVYGQSADVRTACELKSYKTYAPSSEK